MARIPIGNFGQGAGTAPLVRTRVSNEGMDAVERAVGGLAGTGMAMADRRMQLLEQERIRQQEEADGSAMMDFENTLVTTRNRLLEDPNEGAATKRGRDAIGLESEFMPKWDLVVREHVGHLPPRLQENARRLAAQHSQTLVLGLARHELKEADQYRAETANAGLALAIEDAISMRGDEGAVHDAMRRGIDYAAVEWNRLGIVGEQRQKLQNDLVSRMYKRVIDATAQSDPEEAERMLAKHRKHLTASDTLDLEQSLRPAIAERNGRKIAESLLTTGAASAPGGTYSGEVTKTRPNAALVDVDAAARRKLRFDHPQLNGYAALVEQEQGLPPGLLNAIKNSGEKSNSWQTSPAGAQGVMQFMPATATAYGLEDPGDPVASIDAAGRYMHDLLQQYDGNVDAAVAHYNGGGKAGKAVAAGRAPPAKETRDYLARVNATLAPSPAPAARQRTDKPQTAAELIVGLPANLPSAERNAAEAHIRTLVAARDAQQARQDYDDGMAIFNKSLKIPPTQPLTMILSETERQFLAENPEFLGSINRYRELVAAGSVIRDDPVVVDKLHRLRAEDPTAFKTYPIAQHAHELSGETFASFIADQQQASRPDKAAQWGTEAEVLRLAAIDIGLAGDPKARGEFDLAFFREKRSFVQQHKREPNADEMQIIVNRLKQPFVRRKWWGGTETRRLYEGPAGGFTVPAAARAQIMSALQDAGIAAPTEQQIVETYLSSEDARL
ncbi:lytic transglycosylase domain-containing protein [Luteimonas marina]|uniref:Lytic transglycosylase domain-containing protein n=1 Tax=Luteimonas marina TaxID=488485 RepID=A0A5C5UCD4_9GAMM|nr:lytic transglycosylase domain-containing protein [Luteimonas marina]TWT23606.1 lytic transglycosylase domain-containing protein [Luteimonas marina]